MGVFLRQPEHRLPRELFERGTSFNDLVVIAVEARDKHTILAPNIVSSVHHQAKMLCPKYRPSSAAPLELDCASGESDGKPFRPECHKCILGQFSPHGKFCGETAQASASTVAAAY